MDLRENIMMIVSLMVAVIITSSVLFPILDAQVNNLDELDNTTFVNEPKSATYLGGSVKMGEISGVHTFSWDGSSLTFDDATIDLTYSASRIALIVADNIYMTGQNNGWTITSYGNLDGSASASTNSIGTSTSGLSAMTLSFDGMDATLTYTVSEIEHTKTITLSWGFIPSSTGEYVSLSTGAVSDIYYQDNRIWAASNTNGVMVSYNAATGGKINGQEATSSNDSESVPSTDIKKATVGDSVSDDSIQVKNSGGTSQHLFSYVVPASVTYSSGENNSAIKLISVIPVMIVISIVLSAVSFMRRNE